MQPLTPIINPSRVNSRTILPFMFFMFFLFTATPTNAIRYFIYIQNNVRPDGKAANGNFGRNYSIHKTCCVLGTSDHTGADNNDSQFAKEWMAMRKRLSPMGFVG
jgi:hypothetical protein